MRTIGIKPGIGVRYTLPFDATATQSSGSESEQHWDSRMCRRKPSEDEADRRYSTTPRRIDHDATLHYVDHDSPRESKNPARLQAAKHRDSAAIAPLAAIPRSQCRPARTGRLFHNYRANSTGM